MIFRVKTRVVFYIIGNYYLTIQFLVSTFSKLLPFGHYNINIIIIFEFETGSKETVF